MEGREGGRERGRERRRKEKEREETKACQHHTSKDTTLFPKTRESQA